MLSLIALLAAAAATPRPAELRTFQDWTVGCDNGLACEAVGLLPENAESDSDWSGWTTLMIRRGARAGDRPVLLLQNVDGQPAVLLADGRPISVRFSGGADGFTVHGDESVLVDVHRASSRLEVRDAAGSNLGRVSLAGASAAMLYMDEKQRRLGTVTALVRRGSRPATTVPAPPAVPQVRRSPAATDRAPAIGEALVMPLREQSECDPADALGSQTIETEQIATGTTLVLVPCMRGAYNFSALPVIAERHRGRLTARMAPFDSQWAIRSNGHPILVNASWDSDERRLREYSKGRGLGDCGTSAEYVWDGTSFRLIRQEEMGECRGSLTFITTWRAETIGP